MFQVESRMTGCSKKEQGEQGVVEVGLERMQMTKDERWRGATRYCPHYGLGETC